ncbi:MAG TPA: hypothetical protein VJ499_14260 [Flavisolibacter sp.]|nr:hypothetical protein [Flavisolibacter sp.]
MEYLWDILLFAWAWVERKRGDESFSQSLKTRDFTAGTYRGRKYSIGMPILYLRPIKGIVTVWILRACTEYPYRW